MVADRGNMIISATSLVNAIENAAVTNTMASARKRGCLLWAMAVRAMRSNAPMRLSALATASTQKRHPMVSQSK